MPKQQNIIQFSLPKDLLDKLEELSSADESLNLAAKRIFLEAIGKETLTSPNTNLESRIESLESSLEDFKEAVAVRFAEGCQKMSALEKLASNPPPETNQQGTSNMEARIESLESSLDGLVEAITSSPVKQMGRRIPPRRQSRKK